MNTEFIKWKIEKAGFKLVKDKDGDEYVYYTDGQWCGVECIEADEVLNGYLLQRAIDGINGLGLEHLTVSYLASYGWIWLISNKEDMSSESSDIYYDTADDARTALLGKRHIQETTK